MTDTREALLRAIANDPADDAVRLIFADFCEETGETLRAEFVRVQIESANGKRDGIEHADPKTLFGDPIDVGDCACHWCGLRQREKEILDLRPPALRGNEHVGDGWASLPRWSARTHGSGGPFWVTPLGEVTASSSDDFAFERGFVAELTCREEVWASHGRDAVAGWPLQRVFLKERRPWSLGDDSGRYFWEPGITQAAPQQLPFGVGELGGWKSSFVGGLMVWIFDSRDAALLALSEVLLKVARAKG